MVVLFSIPFFATCAFSSQKDDFRFPENLETMMNSCGSSQCIVVLAKDSTGCLARVYAFEKGLRNWRPGLPSFDAVIGRNGLAAIGEKREGDGKTPSGVFPVGLVFGYGPEIASKMPYRQTCENDIWVDDPESPEYNKWVLKGTTSAKSFEEMKRKDHLYKYGMVIEYNTKPIVKGWGSAIFFHIWLAPGESTGGCVAVSEKKMLWLLKWLDSAKKPFISIQ